MKQPKLIPVEWVTKDSGERAILWGDSQIIIPSMVDYSKDSWPTSATQWVGEDTNGIDPFWIQFMRSPDHETLLLNSSDLPAMASAQVNKSSLYLQIEARKYLLNVTCPQQQKWMDTHQAVVGSPRKLITMRLKDSEPDEKLHVVPQWFTMDGQWFDGVDKYDAPPISAIKFKIHHVVLLNSDYLGLASTVSILDADGSEMESHYPVVSIYRPRDRGQWFRYKPGTPLTLNLKNDWLADWTVDDGVPSVTFSDPMHLLTPCDKVDSMIAVEYLVAALDLSHVPLNCIGFHSVSQVPVSGLNSYRAKYVLGAKK